MQEAWNLRPPQERSVDNIVTFILFCEDEINEPTYFQHLQKEKRVKINFVENQNSKHLNLINTIAYCVQNGLMVHLPEAGHRIKRDVTEHIWCVFDRDAESEDRSLIRAKDSIDFTQSIHSAEQAGLRVAWSNDVFEIWILLHFEDIVPGVWQHGSYIYDRLTDIFKHFPEQSAEMQTVTSHPRFNYKTTMKKRANFINYVRPLLATRQAQAIERAKYLENAFGGETPYHDCNPCTKIHHLVNSILSFH